MPRPYWTYASEPTMGKNVDTMIPVEEALKIVLDHTQELDTHAVDLADTLGQVLAEDVRSDMNMPPFDKSAMDGYAVVAADTAGASEDRPAVLDVLEDIPAGSTPTQEISPGKAARIMTGAPVPKGADAVQMVEFTERDDARGQVRIFRAIDPKTNICFLGEDVQEGDLVLRKGTRLRPPEIGILASVGAAKVPVVQRPELAILATGSEIVEPGITPGPGQIRNSNGYSLSAQGRSAGAKVRYLGIVDDTRPGLKGKILDGLKSNVLILSGGVSVGDYDLVKETLLACGVEILFEKVRIKPGKPLTFGVLDRTLVFGLPGNPVSTMVTFENFVLPALRKMAGRRDITLPQVPAILDHPFARRKAERREFAPARSTFRDGCWHTELVEFHGSAHLQAIVEADSFAIISEGVSRLDAGAEVQVQLPGWRR